jgi:hypothetical protein
MQKQRIRLGRLALVVGGVVLGCVAACALVVMLAPTIRRFTNSMLWKTDPAYAAQLAHTLLDYELPAGYHAQKGAEIREIRMVMIAPDSGHGLQIYMVDESLTISEQEDWRMMQEVWAKDIDGRQYNTQPAGEFQAQVRGQPLTVSLREGVDDAGMKVKQALVNLPGKTGDLVIIFFGPAESWNQELVDQFLKSIK